MLRFDKRSTFHCDSFDFSSFVEANADHIVGHLIWKRKVKSINSFVVTFIIVTPMGS